MARRQFDIVPMAVLVAILVVGLAAWWAFPRVQRALSNQDCVASGHVNCGQ
jgi:multidrug resistance efflux pump